MGCVFGKIGIATRTKQNSNNRNASDAGDELKITPPPPPAPVEAKGPNRTESVSEYYSFRTSANSTNQQGWPSWLVAVAGDAIKDWTPRRANTFQKLDKAILLLF